MATSRTGRPRGRPKGRGHAPAFSAPKEVGIISQAGDTSMVLARVYNDGSHAGISAYNSRMTAKVKTLWDWDMDEAPVIEGPYSIPDGLLNRLGLHEIIIFLECQEIRYVVYHVHTNGRKFICKIGMEDPRRH